jgi:hypothetical protein
MVAKLPKLPEYPREYPVLPPRAHVHSRRQRLGRVNRWSLVAWLKWPDGLLAVSDSRPGAGWPAIRAATGMDARPAWTGRWAGHTIWVRARSISVRFTGYSFGSVRVDGVTYDHDLIIDRGKVRKRKKAASRRFRGAYGHTPLSIAEDIPWRCRRLVIGTGAEGALPVMKQVREEARRRKAGLVILPTAEAIDVLAGARKDTNAVLHVTC